jgi:DivIVA domain-containing protein
MSNTFPNTAAKSLGYDPEQVDRVIAKAREQFADANSKVVTADALRRAEFDLVKGGYSISAVDAALDRLDDAFAAREAKTLQAQLGEYGLNDYSSRIEETILGRCERSRGSRFSGSGVLLRGYSKKQVDELTERVYRHLTAKQPLAIEDVRGSLFKSKRGGYAENQVDAFIDKVVELLQIERSRQN